MRYLEVTACCHWHDNYLLWLPGKQKRVSQMYPKICQGQPRVHADVVVLLASACGISVLVCAESGLLHERKCNSSLLSDCC